jgi:hypothetical protein
MIFIVISQAKPSLALKLEKQQQCTENQIILFYMKKITIHLQNIKLKKHT